MKVLILTGFILSSGVVFSQVNSETKPKPVKSTTQSHQTTSGTKLTSGTPSSTQQTSAGPNISNYIKYRNIVLNALVHYDKTAIPLYEHDISEDKNIDLIIQWAYQNSNLIKDSKRNEISDLYNDRF